MAVAEIDVEVLQLSLSDSFRVTVARCGGLGEGVGTVVLPFRAEKALLSET
jgi:hypothetical protein